MRAGRDDGDLNTTLGTREDVLWRTINGVEDTQHGLLFYRHERKESGSPEEEEEERLAWEKTQSSDGWSVEFWTLATGTPTFPNNPNLSADKPDTVRVSHTVIIRVFCHAFLN